MCIRYNPGMTATMNPRVLNEQFGIPHTLRFEAGEGDLTQAVVTGEKAMAVVYLHGAHVTEYEPVGHKNVLFTSRWAEFRQGRPIRGGVPICFPWFGDKASDPGSPKHGLARLREWELASARTEGDDVVLELTTTIDAFALTYRVRVGASLELTLITRNTGPAAATFEEALHTYLNVGQVQNVTLEGLGGAAYLSKIEGNQQRTQDDEPLRFTGPIDRIYPANTATCTVYDPDLKRTLTVEKTHARSTVVWNPWIDGAANIPDLGDEEWSNMLCVESGNVGADQVELGPGETHEITARITSVRD